MMDADLVPTVNAVFQPANGKPGAFQKIAKVDSWPDTTLMSQSEVEVYAEQYAASGVLHSSTNWYRTRKINFDNDVADFAGSDGKLQTLALFISTDLDPVLSPALSIGMETRLPNMTRKSVQTSHWGLIEAKDEVNEIVGEYLMRLHLEKMRHQI